MPQFGIVNILKFFNAFKIDNKILNPLSPNWLSYKFNSFKFFNFNNSSLNISIPTSLMLLLFKLSTSILLFFSKIILDILLSVKEL